jgi:hypothetical protein
LAAVSRFIAAERVASLRAGVLLIRLASQIDGAWLNGSVAVAVVKWQWQCGSGSVVVDGSAAVVVSVGAVDAELESRGAAD